MKRLEKGGWQQNVLSKVSTNSMRVTRLDRNYKEKKKEEEKKQKKRIEKD